MGDDCDFCGHGGSEHENRVCYHLNDTDLKGNFVFDGVECHCIIYTCEALEKAAWEEFWREFQDA